MQNNCILYDLDNITPICNDLQRIINYLEAYNAVLRNGYNQTEINFKLENYLC